MNGFGMRRRRSRKKKQDFRGIQGIKTGGLVGITTDALCNSKKTIRRSNRFFEIKLKEYLVKPRNF